jgi:rod shape-determining protein MreC
MRLRRRHAWSAVLIALFALPVLRPRGFPGLEGWFDQTLSWPARAGLGGPREALLASPSDASAREKDLERLLLQEREEGYRRMEALAQRADLADVLKGLDRLPRALPARILRSRDASPTRRSILIDRGAADGVREGLAVAVGGTFLGVVRHVEGTASRVQLLDDPWARLEVAVRTQEGARAVAWVRGEDSETLRLRNLRASLGLVVRPGDPVTTNHADVRVPAGLLVGQVTEAGDPDQDGALDVRMRPLFDLDRTRSVLVLFPGE